MKPIEDLSTEPGVLAVAYPSRTDSPLIEICDAELRTTIETLLPGRHKPAGRAEYDAALAGLGYSRTSTWRRQHGLLFCDVTAGQHNPTV